MHANGYCSKSYFQHFPSLYLNIHIIHVSTTSKYLSFDIVTCNRILKSNHTYILQLPSCPHVIMFGFIFVIDIIILFAKKNVIHH